MRFYIPDMDDFLVWLTAAGHDHVILRGFDSFVVVWPTVGGKEDVDMLVSDAALAEIQARYGSYKRREGVKCDIYNVTGTAGGDYVGHAYYPPHMSEEILKTRRQYREKFFVPSARMHLLSLIYHIAHHKAEASKVHIDDPVQSAHSKYLPELAGLMAEEKREIPYDLMSFQTTLCQEGYAIPYDVLTAYIQNDYAREFKSLFRARVCASMVRGEMNLFVIRRVAVAQQKHEEIIAALRQHYQVISIKDIPFVTQILNSSKMRGGKWRRGGRPCIAVLVYDQAPQPVSAEEACIHPHVLNARQFMKRALREWFTKETGCKPSANPVHSTDNEAEAIGHLPLFFSPHEQEDIFLRLGALRLEQADKNRCAA